MLGKVNKAVFDRLNGIEGLAVYDYVPENKKRPFVALTETEQLPWDSKTTKGFEVTAGLAIYSGYKGDKEINTIAESVKDALSEKLELGKGYKVITQFLDTLRIERYDDYREGTLSLRLKIYKEGD